MEEKNISTDKQLTSKMQTKGIGFTTTIILILLISFIATIVFSGIFIYYYHKKYALKIIAVDLAGFVESQKESFVSGKVNEKWLTEKREELTQYLKKVPENTLLLTSDVVLSDYPDDNNIPVIKFNPETDKWVIMYVE